MAINVALLDGVPQTLAAPLAASGVYGTTFTYSSAQARRTLAVQAVQQGGTGSTITAQLQASLDGTNFWNVGTALNLGGASATNGATISVDGVEGATLQFDVTTYTPGTGVTGAVISLLLG